MTRRLLIFAATTAFLSTTFTDAASAYRAKGKTKPWRPANRTEHFYQRGGVQPDLSNKYFRVTKNPYHTELRNRTTLNGPPVQTRLFVLTTNTDKRTGERVLLKDLFKPSAAYKISRQAKKALGAKLKAEFGKNADLSRIKQGAGPHFGNFDSSFVITPKGLELNFSSSQVAPNSAKEQTVVIPWHKLKSTVRRDGPLWLMINNK